LASFGILERRLGLPQLRLDGLSGSRFLAESGIEFRLTLFRLLPGGETLHCGALLRVSNGGISLREFLFERPPYRVGFGQGTSELGFSLFEMIRRRRSFRSTIALRLVERGSYIPQLLLESFADRR
jgi:hypothetical protein